MGLRIENYSRTDLGRIALPGHAVAALFWVLPLGRWQPGELDKWWAHFTEGAGVCNRLGLLLVRGQGDRSRVRTRDTVDLAPALTDPQGGRLSELVPELSDEPDTDPEAPAVLVLSGAYPQPGWGVLIDAGGHTLGVHELEDILNEALGRCCRDEDLAPILSTQECFRSRGSAAMAKPEPPARPKELDDARASLDVLDALLRAVASDDSSEMKSAFDRVVGQYRPGGLDPGLKELRVSVSIGGEVARRLAASETALSALISLLANGGAAEAARAGLPPRDAEFLKRLEPLREHWPAMETRGMTAWFNSVFRPRLLERLHAVFAGDVDAADRRHGALAGEFANREGRHQNEHNAWRRTMRQTDAAYHASLPAACLAQWSLGPGFLVALEAVARGRRRIARSVAWDPARMIGWKLHVALPGLQPAALLVAANSVPGVDVSQVGLAPPSGEFNGSIFADYAYFVAMTAPRMTPWEATKRLFGELLSTGQLLGLVEQQAGEAPALANLTKDQLAGELLARWGYTERLANPPRPLAGCIVRAADGSSTLAKSQGEARISLESFLKDLVRIGFSTLGWSDLDAEEKVSVHCHAFKRSRRGSWSAEMESLTAGSALVLLPSVLALAFPQSVLETQELCKVAAALVAALNPGVHDPPRPQPTTEECSLQGQAIVKILGAAAAIVGEMPWHLRPSQVFGSGPAIATGHAWSHSHVEERVIRVLLWSGDGSVADVLVWNKTRGNPVMTEAIVLASPRRPRR
ncbi:hypothetical protein LBMAG42_57210 [Deltaproteobacteria bacterium]|nr:hypothetical protein LBMAG42_57210 [Deltaproteobacteria bacterium]